nr:MAG TPA: zinc-ribbon containing domain protein [Caudoviricetes sp.]
MLSLLPAADVAPVVHGEWVLDAKNHAYCSQCLYGRNIETQIGWNYCPNCGSKMILEDD